MFLFQSVLRPAGRVEDRVGAGGATEQFFSDQFYREPNLDVLSRRMV